MKAVREYVFYLFLMLPVLFPACSKAGTPDVAPEGMAKVEFVAPGNYGAPFSDLKAGPASRAALPSGYAPQPIEDGTTLWVAVYRKAPDGTAGEFVTIKSYRVSGKVLIPCKVDEEGNVLKDENGQDMYDTPLFLPAGEYLCRALGPARKLIEGTADGKPNGSFYLYLKNGEQLIANDERYAGTMGNKEITVEDGDPDVQVELNPLINQTARLKFTVYSAADDPFVHSIAMQPVGIEVSGLQNNYHDEDKVDSDGNSVGGDWNWKFCSPVDTLIAYPGMKDELMYLKRPSESADDRIVIETTILPTTAMSTPMVILFNVNVNGNPTQFVMQLSRKVFRAGYSYHYRGRVKIKDGVSVLEWESVSWNADIPFF